MKQESTKYSKGRKVKPFHGDSEDKEKRSTDSIRLWTGRLLMPTYLTLNNISDIVYSKIIPDEMGRLSFIEVEYSVKKYALIRNWKEFSLINI